MWILVEGAANDSFGANRGHVNVAAVRRDVVAFEHLRAPLALIAAEHAAFTSVVVQAVWSDARGERGARLLDQDSALARGKHHRHGGSATSRCMLPLLLGHEDSLLALVADFAGLLRGRRLRNAAEAQRAFSLDVPSCSAAAVPRGGRAISTSVDANKRVGQSSR